MLVLTGEKTDGTRTLYELFDVQEPDGSWTKWYRRAGGHECWPVPDPIPDGWMILDYPKETNGRG